MYSYWRWLHIFETWLLMWARRLVLEKLLANWEWSARCHSDVTKFGHQMLQQSIAILDASVFADLWFSLFLSLF